MFVLCLAGANVMAADGLTSIKSANGPKETIERLEAAVKARGLTIFAHIPHAKGAASVGVPLRPNDLFIFGNPKVGTPLMQAQPTIGLDLPLRMLVWQDAAGDTWVSFNQPEWLARRHEIDRDAGAASISAMTGALSAIARAATSAP
jgi:uncharacterized protein (DUF302 family)